MAWRFLQTKPSTCNVTGWCIVILLHRLAPAVGAHCRLLWRRRWENSTSKVEPVNDFAHPRLQRILVRSCCEPNIELLCNVVNLCLLSLLQRVVVSELDSFLRPHEGSPARCVFLLVLQPQLPSARRFQTLRSVALCRLGHTYKEVVQFLGCRSLADLCRLFLSIPPSLFVGMRVRHEAPKRAQTRMAWASPSSRSLHVGRLPDLRRAR